MQPLVGSGFRVGSETAATWQVTLVAWLQASQGSRAVPSGSGPSPRSVGKLPCLACLACSGKGLATHTQVLKGPGATAVPHSPTQSHPVHPAVAMLVLTNSQRQQEVPRLEASGRGSGASPFALWRVHFLRWACAALLCDVFPGHVTSAKLHCSVLA